MLPKPKGSVVLCLLFLITNLLTKTATASFLGYYCPFSNTKSFSPGSIYQKNLNHLLSLLSSNATRPNGFYNATAGDPDAELVYGLFLCRGDVTATACQQCVNTATQGLHDECPVEKDSIIWYDDCLLRYSNVSFFSTATTSIFFTMANVGNVSEPTRFMQVLGDTAKSLVQEVANGGIDKKFGTKKVNFSPFLDIYMLAQCTPDLPVLDCSYCLETAVAGLPSCCNGKLGGRVIFPSCYVRYETYSFYTSPAPPLPLQPPTAAPISPASHKDGVSSATIVAIVVPAVLAVSLLSIGCWCITRKAKRKSQVVFEIDQDDDMSAQEFMQFDLATIREATSNFAIDNKLGEGGFGEVYKGKLPNGQDVAVKRLSRSSRQGAGEFKTEVLLVAKLQHRNLVRILGFCLEDQEKLLVYEFVPNKSLDNLLFDRERRGLLDWSIRYKIITGIARGMLYLHEDSRLRIIHRDLKASNILLDGELNPKIADFGLAKIFGVDQTRGNTSRIIGTFGYMAPEYAMHGQFSIKSDVYSFGVLVLEIITGKKNTSFAESAEAADLLGYAWQHWRDGRPLDLLDSELRDRFTPHQVTRCIHIGLLCVQEDPNDRPTMHSIVLMLSSYSISLGTPGMPGYFFRNSITRSSYSTTTTQEFESDKSATNQSLLVSVDEASITQVYPR